MAWIFLAINTPYIPGPEEVEEENGDQLCGKYKSQCRWVYLLINKLTNCGDNKLPQIALNQGIELNLRFAPD